MAAVIGPDAADRAVVVVTGGGRGIGAATALRLARAGWDVCLTWTAHADAAAEVAAACRAAGARVAVVRADVSSETDVAALFTAAAALGPVRALVNNAGTLGRQARVEDLDADRIERTLRVNALGAILCAREAVRAMSSRRGGAGGGIVNVSSRAAVTGGADE